MPVLPYASCLQPPATATIWRYLDLRKFRDLFSSEELYFRRADLFADKSEGLPPERYALSVLGLDPYDIHDRIRLNSHLGSLAQHRESYYISCWHLYVQDTLDMWEQYGDDGVAVCSRYDLLKAALDELIDEAHLGLVQYGTEHLKNTFNALEFITTKQPQYSQDREVRALLAVPDPLAGGNRHFDLNNFPHATPLSLNPRHSWVPECKRRRIDLRSLITDIVISPWAEPDVVEEIELWANLKGFSARHSDLAAPTTPTLSQFRELRHVASKRTTEPNDVGDPYASDDEIARLEEVLQTLSVSRVRFLYRQRWEACRLQPDGIPRAADVQFLQTTLRVLAAWDRQKADVR